MPAFRGAGARGNLDVTPFVALRMKPEQSNAATWIALFGLLVAAAGLLGLAALVLPELLGILLVAAIFFVPTVFHYLVWGRLISSTRDEDDTRADSRSPRPDDS